MQTYCFYNHKNEALFSLENEEFRCCFFSGGGVEGVGKGALISVLALCSAYSNQLKFGAFTMLKQWCL